MKISRQIPSSFDHLPDLICFIIAQLSFEASLTEEEVSNIRLVLEESLTNAIKHGNKFDPSLKVDVTVDHQDGRLTIIVRDQGRGFDFDNVQDPTLLEGRTTRTSGRGVYLIKKIMDEVTFGDGGREIKMVKELSKTSRKAST